MEWNISILYRDKKDFMDNCVYVVVVVKMIFECKVKEYCEY